jgi:hypothetical protein
MLKSELDWKQKIKSVSKWNENAVRRKNTSERRDKSEKTRSEKRDKNEKTRSEKSRKCPCHR